MFQTETVSPVQFDCANQVLSLCCIRFDSFNIEGGNGENLLFIIGWWSKDKLDRLMCNMYTVDLEQSRLDYI